MVDKILNTYTGRYVYPNGKTAKKYNLMSPTKNKNIVVKSNKPITLSQLKKKAIKKDRNGVIECIELEYIVAQDKNFGTKWKFIFDGSAIVDGKYVSNFLLDDYIQKKGQLVFLNGISKQINDKNWSPNGVQVCDGNTIAWNCIGGTMIYKS